MIDPALPASDTAELANIRHRITELERRPNQLPIPMPAFPVFGNPEANGFWSHTLTTPTNIYRGDAYVLARTLDYDINVSGAYGSGAPTSIELEIDILGFGAFPDTTIVTETGAPPQQYAGFVDLVDVIGEDIIGRFVSFRVKVGHTGGTGNAAAGRLNKPLILRIREV